MFIAIDGVDGAGKTTLVRQLGELFGPLDPVMTKEPTGSSHWGRELRAAAIKGRLPREKETEYFHQDRLHHLKTVIKPALLNNRPVITDRYVDSTLAFQTDTPDEADSLYEQFLPDILVPDVTFILDCSVEIGLARIARDRDHISTFETADTLRRARAIYESRKGANYSHIDASGTAESTFKQAIKTLKHRYSNLRPLIEERIPIVLSGLNSPEQLRNSA